MARKNKDKDKFKQLIASVKQGKLPPLNAKQKSDDGLIVYKNGRRTNKNKLS